ncbi:MULTISPECIES: hypothetical protein [Aeromonas]|uniref:hypothetical protein n=1 Tax=Aeromonas TaxID=642 RepID=UPI00107E6A56|nr:MULTISPECIES: hypothetical protein [Aeromonas]MCR9025504.1 hypothetical protein [Aeromonas caviae]QBX72269.1 hypothetical protein E4625_16470 [Aeromonas hydrophila]QBX76969.1 hypothetical protein E4630_16245 [Aeromonas hydrophila]
MDELSWGFIGVISGAVIGASTSIITTILTGKNTFRLQQNANNQERMEKARAFQRETLLAVQETLNDTLRSMMQIHLADLMAAKDGGKWGRNLIDNELDENNRTCNRRLQILTERIADDALRQDLYELHAAIYNSTRATSKEEANQKVNSSVTQAEGFMKHLGAVLRAQYDTTGRG